MTALYLGDKPVAIFMGEVLTDMRQAAAALEKAEADLAALRTLLAAAQTANLSHTERLNRSVDIENYLINASKGNRELPNAEDCKVIALRLGTPYEQWTDYLKKYKYGAKNAAQTAKKLASKNNKVRRPWLHGVAGRTQSKGIWAIMVRRSQVHSPQVCIRAVQRPVKGRP